MRTSFGPNRSSGLRIGGRPARESETRQTGGGSSNLAAVVDRDPPVCGTPFPARPIWADPNRVRDTLLSLNHSKSYICGSDYKIRQAHKHLHLTKYIYNEGIQSFSK